MDSSGTLELQLEAIKVRGKRVRVAVGAMKDWFTMDYSPGKIRQKPCIMELGGKGQGEK